MDGHFMIIRFSLLLLKFLSDSAKRSFHILLQVALSQDDLVLLLNILMENIGEASSIQPYISPDPGIKQANVPVRSAHNGNRYTASYKIVLTFFSFFFKCF